MCLVTGALVVNSPSPHPRLWVLFVVAFAAADINRLQRPSLGAMVPRLVSSEELPPAAAISSLRDTLGTVGARRWPASSSSPSGCGMRGAART